MSDAWKQLGALLQEAGMTVTFDPERSTALPCLWCHRDDVPRDLYRVHVCVGNMRREVGRPLCEGCAESTGAERWR